MGHILGPKCNVFIATLVRLLLAMTMGIRDRECGPFRPIFAVFAILGQVGNTISPCGKRPTQRDLAMLVAYHQGSIGLEFRICTTGLEGVMQPTVRATLPNFAFPAVSCPVA